MYVGERGAVGHSFVLVSFLAKYLLVSDYMDGGRFTRLRTSCGRLGRGCRSAGVNLITYRANSGDLRRHLTRTRGTGTNLHGSCTTLRSSLSGDVRRGSRNGIGVSGLISRVGTSGGFVGRLIRTGSGSSSLGVILAGGLAHSLDHRRVRRISVRILGNIICVSLTSGVLCGSKDCRVGRHTKRALDGVTGDVGSCGRSSILIRNGASASPVGHPGVHGG